MPSVRLPEYELDDLFSALGILPLLDAGSVNTDEGTAVPARLCSIPGAISYDARLTARGGERARVHLVDCPLAGVVGRWTSALRVGDVTLYRVGHQARPAERPEAESQP